MSTTPVVPKIQPPYSQQDFFEKLTGKLTEAGWWFLHDLQQAAQNAVAGSTINVVPLEPIDGVVIPDLAISGPFGSFHLSSASAVTIEPPIFSGGAVPNGAQITIYFDQDSVGGRPAPTFSTAIGGWLPYINQIAIIETLNTRTTYRFGYDGQIWTLLAFQTGEQAIPV